MTVIPFNHYLILGGILFSIGIFGALTRRSAVGILMSIELILNAANINFIAFNKLHGSSDQLGQIFALIVITIAAASAVIGLAIMVAVYRNVKTIFADKINLMKW